MLPPSHRASVASGTASKLALTLGTVPRSARWILPALAAAFEGTDVSTLEPRTRALLLLRVAAVDHAPYWRERFEVAARGVGISDDEVELVGSGEWERVPVFTDRERAAILWGDRVARRLARRDGVAYRIVREEFDDVEIVELTAIASLAAMADRLTNALRISPEKEGGLTPADGPIAEEAFRRWSRSMFQSGTAATWTHEMGR